MKRASSKGLVTLPSATSSDKIYVPGSAHTIQIDADAITISDVWDVPHVTVLEFGVFQIPTRSP